MNNLDKNRLRINEIDKDLTELFEERMQIVEAILSYKKNHALPIFDEERELAVLSKTSSYLNNQDLLVYQQEFMKKIIRLSKDYQYHLLHENSVAYQGVEGAFSYLASKKLFPNYEFVNKNSFAELFQAVADGEVQFAVVPFENSYTGEIGDVLDLLYQHNVYIQSFYDLKIEQTLLGLAESSLADIKEIYSHPQALQQALPFLNNLDVKLIPMENTAVAARYIADSKDLSKAAIAARDNAEIYQLKILAENIQATDDNTTRFIVIGPEMKKNGEHLCLIFATRHEAGQLSKVINLISQYGYNLENIKSRPSKKTAWQYYFYLEIAADYHEDNTRKMLEDLRSSTIDLKIIGIC